MYGITLPTAFNILLAAFIIFPLTERISNAKHVQVSKNASLERTPTNWSDIFPQMMTGMHPATFWFASGLWDYLVYLCSVAATCCILVAMDEKRTFVSNGSAGKLDFSCSLNKLIVTEIYFHPQELWYWFSCSMAPALSQWHMYSVSWPSQHRLGLHFLSFSMFWQASNKIITLCHSIINFTNSCRHHFTEWCLADAPLQQLEWNNRIWTVEWNKGSPLCRRRFEIFNAVNSFVPLGEIPHGPDSS